MKRLVEQLESRVLMSVVNFSTLDTYTSGSGPYAVWVGDINNDGADDLVSSNVTGNTFALRLNDGDGKFSAATTFAVGGTPRDVFVADLNRDGNQDVIVACEGNNILSVLLGNGAGGFGVFDAITVSSGPTSIAIQDFNRDGKPDIVCTLQNAGGIAFFPGVGDGTFGNEIDTATSAGPTQITSGDFNRDGIMDVAVCCQASDVLNVLLGAGNGSFTLSATIAGGNSPFDIASGDVNHDGILDVLTINDDDQVRIARGTGTGTFNAPTTLNTGNRPLDVVVEDYNNDGKIDIAVCNSIDNTVTIFQGTGGGAFAAGLPFACGQAPFALAQSDFNNDGFIDIVTADGAGNSVSVLTNTTGVNATQLTILQDLTDTKVGVKVNPNVTLRIEDAANGLVVGSKAVVNAAVLSGPTGGAIVGTSAVAAINGIATFSNLKFNKVGTYTLQFSSGTLASATSVQFTVTPGDAAKLVFVQQPTNAVAGATISPAVTVQVQDAFGNLVDDDTSNVTLQINTGPNGANPLGGTVTVAAVGGIATFNDLNLETQGNYTLKATDGLLTSVNSKSFTISPDLTTAHLEILREGGVTAVGNKLSPTIQVAIEDQFGNIIKTDKSKITIAATSAPGGGSLSGTLEATPANGIATFTNVTANVAGNYTIEATAGVADPTPASYVQVIQKGATTISKPAASAAGYAFGATSTLSASLKSNSPILATGNVTLEDAGNNVLATAAIGAGGSLKFALANIAPGTYTCTLVYAGDAAHTAGTSAAFTLKINKAKTSVVLTTNPASALSGQDVVLSAFVKAATGGSTARTGNVIFKDNGVTIATVAVDGTSTAAFTDVAPDTGAHKYTAEYEGDDNFLAGPAVSKSVTVKKNKVTGVLAADLPNPVALNTDVEFTLQLTVVAPGTTTPTGNVTFKDGATILGTVALDGSGLATLSNIQFTTAGTHKITATYVGDLNTFNFTSTSLSVITA